MNCRIAHWRGKKPPIPEATKVDEHWEIEVDDLFEFAEKHGIATITFFDGKLTYETRTVDQAPPRPPWIRVPRWAGHFLSAKENSIRCSLVGLGRVDPIDSWLEN